MTRLTLAVAGGRKTQGIVDHCVAAPPEDRVLVLTYTIANQGELSDRLAARAPLSAQVSVQGWFSFLLSNWVRPYLPRLFPGRVLRGLNFEGDPGRYATGEQRFLDDEGRAYMLHLARLATEVDEKSGGAVMDRLRRIYHRVWIDEVQDLNGYDLVVIERMIESGIELEMVGDVRQAILQTNVQDPKYAQFKGVEIKHFFDHYAKKGLLQVEHRSTTWRCNATIASVADQIFATEGWDFAPTESLNDQVTGHDGVFAVAPEHVGAYVAEFDPLCLRYNAGSGKDFDLPFINIGIAKGLEAERVLLVPTGTMADYVRTGKALAPSTACRLYVAVTRARASVALVVERPERFGLPVWRP